VITFPNCKINLGLHILARRNDGFHDLETVFFPVPFEDVLEVERSNESTSLTLTGLEVEGKVENNLCMKAYALLKSRYDLPLVDMRLHKQIPSGAGLGGGSSNAAFTLKLLNEKFNLNLSQNHLVDLASEIGSDCSFFILNRPCVGTGKGHLLEPIELPQLHGLCALLVMPGIHISSAWAFQQVKPRQPVKSIEEIISMPIANWQQQLTNDFEQPIFETYPALKEIKEQLYKGGARYASLSGSGSAMYGLFDQLPSLAFPPAYMVKTFVLNHMES
jgi:4-diphosphocytidyl-2-C-methyl-D-erythritol kinase